MNEPEPRHYHATEIMPELWAADDTPTTVQPLPALRDAARPGHRKLPDSALDLPLWRPTVSATAKPHKIPKPEKPVEQTNIQVVATHVVYALMRHETAKVYNEWIFDNQAVYANTMAGVAADLAELDEYARRCGFHNAVARSLGRRMGRGQLTAAGAMEELNALH